MTCRETHLSECYEGWTPDDTIVVGKGEKRIEYPTLAPCPRCRPGQRAVWAARLLKPRWNEDERAVRIFLRATVEEDPRLMPSVPPEPKALWRKIMAEFPARSVA